MAGAALEEGPGGCTKGALFLTPLSRWALLWVLCQLRGLLPSASLAGLGAQKVCVTWNSGEHYQMGQNPGEHYLGGLEEEPVAAQIMGGRDVPRSTHQVRLQREECGYSRSTCTLTLSHGCTLKHARLPSHPDARGLAHHLHVCTLTHTCKGAAFRSPAPSSTLAQCWPWGDSTQALCPSGSGLPRRGFARP